MENCSTGWFASTVSGTHTGPVSDMLHHSAATVLLLLCCRSARLLYCWVMAVATAAAAAAVRAVARRAVAMRAVAREAEVRAVATEAVAAEAVATEAVARAVAREAVARVGTVIGIGTARVNCGRWSHIHAVRILRSLESVAKTHRTYSILAVST